MRGIVHKASVGGGRYSDDMLYSDATLLISLH